MVFGCIFLEVTRQVTRLIAGDTEVNPALTNLLVRSLTGTGKESAYLTEKEPLPQIRVTKVSRTTPTRIAGPCTRLINMISPSERVVNIQNYRTL